MSLQKPRQKMSKSDPDARASILITDPPEVIRSKVMSALTDSVEGISYDPDTRPGVSNLVELLALLDGSKRTPQEIAAEMESAGASLKQLKETVAATLTRKLEGIRERYSDALERDDGQFLDRVQAHGAESARNGAAETMQLVRDAVGL
jgi:tryptophanyl-tRNA synthetase